MKILLGTGSSSDHAVYMRVCVLIRAITLIPADCKVRTKIIALLYAQGIWSRQDVHRAVNNHGLMLDFGLLHLSVFFFKQSFDWQKRALERIVDSVISNFDSDGVNNENTPEYHIYNCNLYKWILEFCNSHDIIDDSLYKIQEVLNKADVVYRYMVWPDGKCPPIGDFVKGITIDNPINKSIWFKEANFVIIKSDDLYLSLKCGYTFLGHKHIDEGSITLRYKNIDLIVDTGNFSYDYENPIRKFNSSSQGHSGLYPTQIDDKERYGYGKICSYAKVEAYKKTDKSEHCSSRYRLENGIEVTRDLIYENNHIKIIDKYVNTHITEMRLRYILSPSAKILKQTILLENTIATMVQNQNIYFCIITSHKNAKHTFALNDGYYSRAQHKYENCKCIDLFLNDTKECEITTNIFWSENLSDVELKSHITCLSSVMYNTLNRPKSILDFELPLNKDGIFENENVKIIPKRKDILNSEQQAIEWNFQSKPDENGVVHPNGKFGMKPILTLVNNVLLVTVDISVPSDNIEMAVYLYRNDEIIEKNPYKQGRTSFECKLTLPGDYSVRIFMKKVGTHYSTSDVMQNKTAVVYKLPMLSDVILSEAEKENILVRDKQFEQFYDLITATMSAGVDILSQHIKHNQ